jgi:hypothetical protein
MYEYVLKKLKKKKSIQTSQKQLRSFIFVGTVYPCMIERGDLNIYRLTGDYASLSSGRLNGIEPMCCFEVCNTKPAKIIFSVWRHMTYTVSVRQKQQT